MTDDAPTLSPVAFPSRTAPPPRRAPAVRRATSATQIFEALRTEIVACELPPGTALVDRMLVERFAVSRTPVREALIRLSEIGLVDIYPQSGTFVSRVPVAAIPEAVVIRTALEGVTVEAAARGADPAAAAARLARLIDRQRAMAASEDAGGFHEADEAFHAELASIAGFPGIWRLLAQVKVQIDRARRLTLPALGRMERVIGEHETIRERVAAGDAPGARAAMTRHLAAVVPDVEVLRGLHPDYFS